MEQTLAFTTRLPIKQNIPVLLASHFVVSGACIETKETAIEVIYNDTAVEALLEFIFVHYGETLYAKVKHLDYASGIISTAKRHNVLLTYLKL